MTGNKAYTTGFREIGQDVIVWPEAKIVSPESISLGNSVIIDDFVLFFGGALSLVGSFVHIAAFTLIAGGGEFVMDDFAGLSGGVKIYTGNEDYLGGSLTNPAVPFPYRNPVRSRVHLQRHAIVGANSVVLPGVVVGEGAVVGANSLVNKDCEPWHIYIGSPARKVRPRPKDRILELEQKLRDEVFDAAGRYMPSHIRTGSKQSSSDA